MEYTIDKVGGSFESKHAELFGRSTSTKPTLNVKEYDIFVEFDTGDAYYFDGVEWKILGEEEE